MRLLQVRIILLVDVLLDKFKSTMREEVAAKNLEDARIHNATIEEVVQRIREEN